MRINSEAKYSQSGQVLSARLWIDYFTNVIEAGPTPFTCRTVSPFAMA
jgi:hypothetical protein